MVELAYKLFTMPYSSFYDSSDETDEGDETAVHRGHRLPSDSYILSSKTFLYMSSLELLAIKEGFFVVQKDTLRFQVYM